VWVDTIGWPWRGDAVRVHSDGGWAVSPRRRKGGAVAIVVDDGRWRSNAAGSQEAFDAPPAINQANGATPGLQYKPCLSSSYRAVAVPCGK